MNGLGERCGNANLCSLLPNLMLKEPFASQFETGVTRENLAQLTHVSRLLDEILNRAPDRYAAYVGASAFTHKGGLHSSAVLKDPHTYEHVPPEIGGQQAHHAGFGPVGPRQCAGAPHGDGIEVDAKDACVAPAGRTSSAANSGYAYDGADASFELLALRAAEQAAGLFHGRKFSVTVESRRRLVAATWCPAPKAGWS